MARRVRRRRSRCEEKKEKPAKVADLRDTVRLPVREKDQNLTVVLAEIAHAEFADAEDKQYNLI